MLKRNTSQQNTGISLRDALTVYLNKQQQICNTGTSCDAMACPADQQCSDTPRGKFCTVTTDGIIDTTDVIECTTNEDCPTKECVGAMPAMMIKGKCKPRTVKQRWGNISCLDGLIETHDGRIRPVFE